MDKSERFQEKRQGLDREEIPVFRLTNATVDTRMSLDEQVIASTRHRYEALRVPLNSRGISSLRQRAMTGPAHLVSASSNAVANLGLQDGPPTRAGGGAATQDSKSRGIKLRRDCGVFQYHLADSSILMLVALVGVVESGRLGRRKHGSHAAYICITLRPPYSQPVMHRNGTSAGLRCSPVLPLETGFSSRACRSSHLRSQWEGKLQCQSERRARDSPGTCSIHRSLDSDGALLQQPTRLHIRPWHHFEDRARPPFSMPDPRSTP